MTQNALRKDILLHELGDGAGYFMLAFRGIAFGKTGCKCLNKFYGELFGDMGDAVLSDIFSLTASLGRCGHRKIRLAQPGCAHVTLDEVSLLSALGAAQSGQDELHRAHLRWLLVRGDAEHLIDLTSQIAGHFESIGLDISTPELSGYTPARQPDIGRMTLVGTA
ncbi:hypothetical protein [Ponticaulis sp.]|uniref:hypothetical protein n=1 Tax=Ponticaulis sp. TaxID=2020902 RepID=UPI000B704884|nr:hypothetical protein [Ponticaulis sp.]MAI91907.1 hypothetical protein [Ponticaulis sp.]OUX96584.1 MAG: hypothetical protein CBB65_15865 [Hyphomonadaceae bacterium TMED5]|tara:strand:- start:24237 stop:24731 length:495 start_codon:yes stop_codon:yes gene_type:complete